MPRVHGENRDESFDLKQAPQIDSRPQSVPEASANRAFRSPRNTRRTKPTSPANPVSPSRKAAMMIIAGINQTNVPAAPRSPSQKYLGSSSDAVKSHKPIGRSCARCSDANPREETVSAEATDSAAVDRREPRPKADSWWPACRSDRQHPHRGRLSRAGVDQVGHRLPVRQQLRRQRRK